MYSAFQVRLIELRREMERHVTLLEAREGVAKRAWLAYEEAASQSGEGPRPLKLLAGEYPL